MSLLKELLSWHRFLKKTPQEAKQIVFYAEHEGYYSYFEGVIRELVDKYGKVICYITSDPKDPIFQQTNPRINPFYLNKLLGFFLGVINCKVFVMTLTDLNQFHLKRSLNPVHYVYMFHAMVSTHMMYRKGAFDYYDSILMVGPHHEKEIRKYEQIHGLDEKVLVQAGYYRLERIYSNYRTFREKHPVKRDRTTVLIAPSWGDQNILESCGRELIRLLLKQDYEVVVRPHPETMKRSQTLIEQITQEFGENDHFSLERSVSTDESLLKADVLICDCSGVALEYAFGTERPVLFIDVPYKIQNQEFHELEIEPLELSIRSEIGVIVSVENLDNIPKIIQELQTNRIQYQKRIAQLREKHVYAFGHASQIGAEHVVQLLAI